MTDDSDPRLAEEPLPPGPLFNRAKWEDDWVPQVVGTSYPDFPEDLVAVITKVDGTEKEVIVQVRGLHPSTGEFKEFYQLAPPDGGRLSWFLRKLSGDPSWAAIVRDRTEVALAAVWIGAPVEPGARIRPPHGDPDLQVRVRPGYIDPLGSARRGPDLVTDEVDPRFEGMSRKELNELRARVRDKVTRAEIRAIGKAIYAAARREDKPLPPNFRFDRDRRDGSMPESVGTSFPVARATWSW